MFGEAISILLVGFLWRPQEKSCVCHVWVAMGVTRDRTVVVKKSEGIVPDYSSFCDLVEKGVFCDPELVTQVTKSGDEYHVSFKSKEVMMQVAATYRKESNAGTFFVDPVERKRAYIKVYDLPYEVPSRAVSEAFLKYGAVGEATRDKFPGRNFLNGIRTVPILLNDGAELPETMSIEGFSGRVLNTSAPHCNICKKNGHLRKECTNLTCNYCFEWGHFSNKCPQAFCNTCKDYGHWTRQCKPKKQQEPEVVVVVEERAEVQPGGGKTSYAEAVAPARKHTTKKQAPRTNDKTNNVKRRCTDEDGAVRGLPPLPGQPITLSNRFAHLDDGMDYLEDNEDNDEVADNT